MLFTSYEFIAFMLLCFIIYYLIPKKCQWMMLLIASYVFYFCAGTYYPLFILATTATTYFFARKMDSINAAQEQYLAEHKDFSREEKKAYKGKMASKRKTCMLLCLLFNIGILAVIKYTNFVIHNINGILAATGSETEIAFVEWLLPMGISFYTFQSVGYLLDVYWGKVKAQKNFFKFALFVSFFPQLVQGPISRYADLEPTLFAEHKYNWYQVKLGLERIVWGFFKKLVIADRLLVAVRYIIEDPEYYSGAFVLVGMIFYAIELYADFTGGIDITIGIAQVFGVKLNENFERPYFSKNIAEYWRRWHITMGTWFRDYIFYPMSISKSMQKTTGFAKKHFGKGVAKRLPVYIATMVTWFATGIWHGASWNFVVWGLMNGLVILISQEFQPLYDKFHAKFPKIGKTTGYKMFQIGRTFLLMSSLRLFDCYADVKTAFMAFFSIFTNFDISMLNAEEFLYFELTLADYIIMAVGVVIMLIVSLLGRKGSVREQLEQKPTFVRYTVYATMLLCVILFGAYSIGYDATQFIYNQF